MLFVVHVLRIMTRINKDGTTIHMIWGFDYNSTTITSETTIEV